MERERRVEAVQRIARTGAQRGAEVDRVGQRDVGVLVDRAHAEREAVGDGPGRGQGEVDDLHVGLDGVVAADPVGVVFGLQAERRADAGAQAEVADRRHERERRDDRGIARIAAVAAVERGAEGRGAAAVEFGVEVDVGGVDLEGRLREVDHRRRVVGDDRGVVLGDRGAGIGATEVLDAVLAQLEARRLRLAEGQGARDTERENRNLGNAGSGVHWKGFSGMSLSMAFWRGLGLQHWGAAIDRPAGRARRTMPYPL